MAVLKVRIYVSAAGTSIANARYTALLVVFAFDSSLLV